MVIRFCLSLHRVTLYFFRSLFWYLICLVATWTVEKTFQFFRRLAARVSRNNGTTKIKKRLFISLFLFFSQNIRGFAISKNIIIFIKPDKAMDSNRRRPAMGRKCWMSECLHSNRELPAEWFEWHRRQNEDEGRLNGRYFRYSRQLVLFPLCR